MRTLMVLNGPGVRAGQKLANVRIIDFAPTLARLIGIPKPKDATGRVLNEALAPSMIGAPALEQRQKSSQESLP
jgi:arylsulfatase A-like enzyme